MRNCKRCKINEAVIGSLNCQKCKDRNDRHNNKLIAENKQKILKSDSSSKPSATYGAYGGLGREIDEPGFDYSAYDFN